MGVSSFVVSTEPFLERVPVIVDSSIEIQAYGLDNLYPQRAEYAVERSFTTKTATNRFADFLFGKGFSDPTLADLIVNRDGQTMNDLLRFVTKDYSVYHAYALHFNYNLQYRIKEINLLKFKFARFGIPTRTGRTYDVKICNNWEDNPYKGINRKHESIFTFPIFDPRPNIVKEQILEHGGINRFPGQILMATPEMFIYPAATFDTVWDYAQVQRELGVFDISKLQNGLTATMIFKYPGEFDEENPRDEFENDLRKHQGGLGANSVMVIEAPDGASENKLIEPIQLQNMDKLHTDLYRTARNSIRETYSQPAEIHGTLPEAGMFNTQQIMEAYTYYNAITQTDRDSIVRQIKKVMAFWWQPNLFNVEILPKTYGIGQPLNNPPRPTVPPTNGDA